ncbi:MAG: hypothetical protein J6X28_02710 [Bacilli bacterium]|nr:hypothetical protein [Bacilli bacterium]
MDVVVSNKYRNNLVDLDADIIKSVTGVFEAAEIGEMFKDFFFDRLIIDVTAFKSYDDYNIYQRLVQYLDPDKMILLLPEGSKLCTPNFLSHLISFGIYNFTTNINGINYLLKKSNTLQDVEHIAKMASQKKEPPRENRFDEEPVSRETRVEAPRTQPATKPPTRKNSMIIGVRNVTASAGATTLIYMMRKELAMVYGQDNVVAIEIDKNDFSYFYDKRMFSVKQVDLRSTLEKFSNVKIILVDLNGSSQESFCNDIIYLIEPSTLKLNHLIQRNRAIFKSLVGKKVVLNQSILQNNDVFDFETEAGIRIFYNIPPLDERKRNSIIADFLSKIGLLGSGDGYDSSGKIFGLFRR